MILNRTAKDVRSVVINGGVFLLEDKSTDYGKRGLSFLYYSTTPLSSIENVFRSPSICASNPKGIVNVGQVCPKSISVTIGSLSLPCSSRMTSSSMLL